MRFNTGDRVVVSNIAGMFLGSKSIFKGKTGIIASVRYRNVFGDRPRYIIVFDNTEIQEKNKSDGNWLWRDEELNLLSINKRI